MKLSVKNGIPTSTATVGSCQKCQHKFSFPEIQLIFTTHTLKQHKPEQMRQQETNQRKHSHHGRQTPFFLGTEQKQEGALGSFQVRCQIPAGHGAQTFHMIDWFDPVISRNIRIDDTYHWTRVLFCWYWFQNLLEFETFVRDWDNIIPSDKHTQSKEGYITIINII